MRKRVDNIFNHLWTQTEVMVGAATSSLWALLSFCVGGIDAPMKALAVLMCLDFITGIIAGWVGKELSSHRGTNGIFKKMIVLICVTMSYMLDVSLGTDMLRGMAIAAFSVIEAMSLMENIDRMGYGSMIPNALRIRLAQIADEKKIKRGEDKND